MRVTLSVTVTPSQPRRPRKPRAHDAVRVDEVLARRAAVEGVVRSDRFVERDDGRADGLCDLGWTMGMRGWDMGLRGEGVKGGRRGCVAGSTPPWRGGRPSRVAPPALWGPVATARA